MSMQWPIHAGDVRPVLWRVLLAGVPLTGCESVDIHSTSHRKASTVHAIFSLSADPASVDTWADMDPPVLMEVQASLTSAFGMASTWESVFTGEANDIHIDVVQMKVDVSGRDLAGRLIDGKTVETFRNNTGSEIVEIIAARFGMTADVDATTIKAGSYYQLEHDKLTTGSFSKTTNYWDLLCFLAGQDYRDLYVTGTTLHYKEPVDLLAGPSVPLVWTPPPASGGSSMADLVDLTMHRSLVLAKGIKVVVRIWDSKGKNAKNVIYPPGAGKDAQEFVFTKSGWSAEKALQFAQSNYADILRHQRALEIRMPGEFSLSCRSAIELSGVPGKTFNTKYIVDEITRTFDYNGGFSQSVSLKNHSSQSDAEVG